MNKTSSEIEAIQAQARLGYQDPLISRIFLSFLRLGVTAFGGPAMIPYVRRVAVEQQKWIDGETFQNGLALCQTIPGATVIAAVAAFAALFLKVGILWVVVMGTAVSAFVL